MKLALAATLASVFGRVGAASFPPRESPPPLGSPRCRGGVDGTPKTPLARGDGDAAPSVALFAYNFANYRDELARYNEVESPKRSARIRTWRHRYLFVDDATRASRMAKDGWTVCEIPRDYIPHRAFPARRPRPMNASWELTKYFKFGHVPEPLQRFDYALHMDMSVFIGHGYRRIEYSLPTSRRVQALVREHPTAELFLVRHHSRTRLVDEWNKTTYFYGHEDQALMCGFRRAMRAKFGDGLVDRAPLFGLGEFVRKLDADALDDAFVDTFRTLLAFGLRRDQNVFSLALWNRYGRGTADAVLACFAKGKVLAEDGLLRASGAARRHTYDMARCEPVRGPPDGRRGIFEAGRALDGPPFGAVRFACDAEATAATRAAATGRPGRRRF